MVNDAYNSLSDPEKAFVNKHTDRYFNLINRPKDKATGISRRRQRQSSRATSPIRNTSKFTSYSSIAGGNYNPKQTVTGYKTADPDSREFGLAVTSPFRLQSRYN